MIVFGNFFPIFIQQIFIIFNFFSLHADRIAFFKETWKIQIGERAALF